MKKRTKRLLAMLLASAMILQQGSTVGVLASESEPASETVAETTTATEAETKAPETQAPETKASETQAPETKAPETQAASETQATEASTSAPQTETATSETTETAAETTEKMTEAAATEATEAPAEIEEAPDTEVDTEAVTEKAEETEAPKTNFTYEDSRVKITAVAQEAAKLPQDAQIHADYMQPGTAAYNEAAAALEAAYAGKDVVLSYVFYDIYFTAASAGNGRIEPEAGTVTVSMQFKQPELKPEADAEVQTYDVVHVENGKAQEVPSNVQTTGDGSVASVGFTSDSFSPYAVVIGQNPVETIDADEPMVIPDEVQSDNLQEFLSSVDIKGMEFDASTGKYTATAGKSYEIDIYFRESEGKQFANKSEMTYQLPANLTPVGEYPIENTFDITITEYEEDASGKLVPHEYTIEGNTYKIESNGTVKVNFNTSDEDFTHLEGAANVEFGLRVSASFAEKSEGWKLDFGNDQTKDVVVIQPVNEVTVEKTGVFNQNTGKMDYTITVKSEGENTNVVVTDTYNGNLFVMPEALSEAKTNTPWEQDYTKGTFTKTPTGFTYTIPEMRDGEIITLKYSADVNFDVLDNGTVSSTGMRNDVKVNSDEDKEGDDDYDEQHEIDYKNGLVSKGDSDYEDGDTELDWSFSVNTKHRTNMGGKAITDTIGEGSREYLTYVWPITVTVTKKDGTSETRSLNQSDVTVETDASGKIYSWTYTPPTNDENASYEFKYKTSISGHTGQTEDLTFSNTASSDGHSDTGSAKVEVKEENKLGVKKTVSSTTATSITWKIFVDVPEVGLDSCVVTDYLPNQGLTNAQGNWVVYYDELDKDSISVDGLLSQEDYTCEYTPVSDTDSTVKEFRITFYKDKTKKESGLLESGSKRTLTITFTTEYNKEWLAREDYKTHKNNVTMNANGKDINTSAEYTITNQTMEKTVAQEPWYDEEEAKTLPYFKYTILLSGVSSKTAKVIEDTFDTTLLKHVAKQGVGIAGCDTKESWDSGHSEGGSISWEDTPTGGKITINKFPMKSSTQYYPYYKIFYFLKPVDEDALAKLSSNGTVISNTAKWGEVESTCTTTYDYTALTKNLDQSASKDNDYKAKFRIEINKNKGVLNNGNELTVTDTLTNLRFLPDTLVVTSDGVQIDPVHFNLNRNVLKIQVPDASYVVITYEAYVVGENGENVTYSNSAEVTGYSKGDSKSGNATIDTSGGGLGSIPSIRIVKHEEGDYSIGLPGVTFSLERKAADGTFAPVTGKEGPVTVTTNAQGVAIVSGHMERDGWTLTEGAVYHLVEVAPPNGYRALSDPIEFSITRYPIAVGQYGNGDTIYVGNVKLIDKTVEKVWSGDSATDRPASIQVQLLANGVASGDPQVLNAANGWTYTWTGLPKTDAEGNVITYTIEEIGTVPGYTTSYATDETTGKVTITNTYTQKKGSLTVTKNVTGDNTDTTTVFHFKVTLKDGAAAAAVNGTFDDVDFKDGVATFDLTPGSSMTASKTITGLPAGLNYTVEEFTNAGEKTGYTLTGKTGDTGTIVADNTVTATFTNTRNKTKAELKVEKTYNDTFPTAEAEQFSFTLKDAGNDVSPATATPMPAGSNGGSKTVKVTSQEAVSFDEISYEVDGTYNYTITENSGSLSGVTYDTNVYYVRVKVTTDTKGKKKAEISVAKAENADVSVTDRDYVPQNDITIYTAKFNNTYVADGSANLSVQKVFNDTFPTDEKAFKFILTAGTNTVADPKIDTPMPAGSSADGKTKTMSVESGAAKSFGAIAYEQDGDYFYTIEEVTTGTGLLSDVIYDQKVYQIRVSVKTEKVDGKDAKKATVSYRLSDTENWQDTKQAAFTATFTNYKIQDAKAELKVKKSYNGTNWPTGNDAFKFTLAAGTNTITGTTNGTPMPSKSELTVTNDIAQTFGEITFEKDGTYNYQISETKGSFEGVTYDDTVYDVKVTVSTNSDGTRTVKVESKEAEEDESEYSEASGTTFTAEFNNVYTETQEEASGKLELNVTKSMKNPASKKDLSKFAFTLKQTSPETPELKIDKNADADGNAKFELLYGDGDKGKTFVYEITEQPGSDATVIYDSTVYKVTVKVADKADDEGVLTVEIQSVTKKVGETTTDLGAKGAVTFTNDETTVAIDKIDKDTKASLKDATLRIVKKGAAEDDPAVDEWTTGDKPHDVTGKLEIGGSYQLVETAAPSGYTIADPVEFSVNDKGQIVVAGEVVTAITMEDTKNKISILKVDKSGSVLANAKLIIKDADGTPVESWTTDDKPHELTGMKPGTYTVSELEAPAGYNVAPDQTFTVTGTEKDGDVIQVEMEDEKTATTNRSLTVTKHLRLDIEGFEGQIGLKDTTFYVALFSDEAKTQRVSDVKKIEFKNATVSSAVFTNLEADKTYYVGETDVNGTLLPAVIPEGSDDIVYPEYGSTAQFKFEGSASTGVADFTNVYIDWPDDYYLSGQLTVTKKVLLNGVEHNSTDTFYARVFRDAALTTPASDVLTLNMAGSSTASATVTNLTIGDTPGSSRSYYVAETDANGVPLNPSAVEFEISVDKSEVVLSAENDSPEVVITNKFTEEEESESETEEEEAESESESESETEVSEKKTAPKTGDDTDFMKYLLLMALSAGTCAVIFDKKRRGSRAER